MGWFTSEYDYVIDKHTGEKILLPQISLADGELVFLVYPEYDKQFEDSKTWQFFNVVKENEDEGYYVPLRDDDYSVLRFDTIAAAKTFLYQFVKKITLQMVKDVDIIIKEN